MAGQNGSSTPSSVPVRAPSNPWMLGNVAGAQMMGNYSPSTPQYAFPAASTLPAAALQSLGMPRTASPQLAGADLQKMIARRATSPSGKSGAASIAPGPIGSILGMPFGGSSGIPGYLPSFAQPASTSGGQSIPSYIGQDPNSLYQFYKLSADEPTALGFGRWYRDRTGKTLSADDYRAISWGGQNQLW